MIRTMILGGALALASAAPLAAHDYTVGAIALDHPWARETAPGQKAGGGFVSIHNSGKTSDRLISGSTPVAAEVQVHSVNMDGGIMRMRRMTDGLSIAPGETVVLKPGSFHVMFVGLKQPLKAGTTIPVTLRFQKAGAIRVQFAVQSLIGGDHGSH
ncbi:copper chaperone PCu(A)C [Sphingobium sufflavum]|uniref:copper chaperone PCu(A)C n=1 Tax=Sphingobium sufflavum TaxID=1129547 RepID=UPI001F272C07|nr:copper chaperone PCu(A)C [Sphingobium sufflavum]MCE7798059.1 copper chaperone PCu(A)C [Sphingobium sufflavum]